MAFEPRGPRGLVLNVVARALLLAALAVALLHLLLDTRYYATALVLLLAGAAVIADLIAVTARAQRASERFLLALAAGSLELPVHRASVPAGLHQAYAGVAARLSEQRRNQLQHEQYLQTLLDTVPAAVLVVDAKGGVQLVNRMAHGLLGQGAATLRELPSLSATTVAELDALAPGSHRIVRLADGRSLLASAAQFSTADGGARRLIALQRLAGDLDAVELKAWDDMARVLAHEMLNSLTPIASLSESLDALLRQGDRNADVAVALETIRRRSQGLMSFVERYRTVADVPEPQRQTLSLRALLADVERLIRPTLAERGIQFTSRIEPGLAVLGDRELLEQALINILRNATEALSGHSGAEARIEISCTLHEGLCHIDVADNGPGLVAAVREQLFVPFFTTKPDGSGIGLSLARRIVQRHGGQLQARANFPRGTVFQLSLPAAPDAPAAVSTVHGPPT
jgi:two-component system, NtrC family, nitrogen regulation sensor histidine kinase NtrY